MHLPAYMYMMVLSMFADSMKIMFFLQGVIDYQIRCSESILREKLFAKYLIFIGATTI